MLRIPFFFQLLWYHNRWFFSLFTTPCRIFLKLIPSTFRLAKQMRHALRANNRRNNAATRGERREPCQNMHWPRPSLWRDFQGINGLKIEGFFETSKVLWNVLAYFKEKFERQFRITAKWRFHPCSCSLFTYFSDWNPFNSGFSNFIPKDLFPMQNNQFDSPPGKTVVQEDPVSV